MGKAMGEIGKIIVAAIISIFSTYIVMSKTIIEKKADVDYVNVQDDRLEKEIIKVSLDYKEKDKELKEDFIRIVEKIDKTITEQGKDIKELLKR